MKKIIIVENIRSLHNVGSIFRTADAAGVEMIYLCGYTGCPPDRRIEKVSLGAENFITWKKEESAIKVCETLKQQNFEIIALEQTSVSTDIFTTKYNNSSQVLILGNEVEGISTDLLFMADKHVEIPMYGQKGSLNVSVACGIACYKIFSSYL